MRTGCAGRAERRLPAITAMKLCSTSASAVPRKTGRGRCRVASTSAASAVLSGISARKITPKTEAKVAREVHGDRGPLSNRSGQNAHTGQ